MSVRRNLTFGAAAAAFCVAGAMAITSYHPAHPAEQKTIIYPATTNFTPAQLAAANAEDPPAAQAARGASDETVQACEHRYSAQGDTAVLSCEARLTAEQNAEDQYATDELAKKDARDIDLYGSIEGARKYDDVFHDGIAACDKRVVSQRISTAAYSRCIDTAETRARAAADALRVHGNALAPIH